jgi:hypothetical protein
LQALLNLNLPQLFKEKKQKARAAGKESAPAGQCGIFQVNAFSF